MDGSYNNAFRGSTSSPMSPDTPMSATYRTNVSRQKTKKWVEAKKQNYDGDDWGNDYDDEPEPQEPLPPIKPTGLRQPGQGLSPAQPHTPQATGPTSPARQIQSVPDTGPSSSPRSISGLPPLQIQTQHSPASAPSKGGRADVKSPLVSGPSSMDSATERPPFEQIVSPQSAIAPPRTSSPMDSNRMSPNMSVAAPIPNRFPPRKRSISQQEAEPASNSRPGSSHRPWMEQRSASPASVKSTGTPTKGTPFIRPADIYRRMEEEKERDRRSMESGRPSLDSVGGIAGDRSASPVVKSPVATNAEPRMRSGLGKDDASEASRSPRPALETVAERKSEYGLERVLAQTDTSQMPTTLPTVEDKISAVPAPISTDLLGQAHVESVTAEEEGPADRKRFSTSPRLPDLARMSAFGDDLFSNPSRFASDAPPVPPLQAKLATLTSISPSNNSPSLADEHAGPKNVEVLPPSNRSMDGAGQPSTLSDGSNAAQPSSKPTRPSLPGAWVTETRSVQGDEDARTGPVPAKNEEVDPGEVSPISETDDELDGGKTSGREDPKTAVTAASGSPSVDKQVQNSANSSLATVSEAGIDRNSAEPLKPRAKGDSPNDFVAPERLERELTMSTITSSPAKESDKLREEIIRSLSPIRPTAETNDVADRQEQVPAGRDGPGVRESSYLSSLYDDYWAATDDRSPESSSKRTVTEASGGAQEPLSTSAEPSSAPEYIVSDVAPLAPHPPAPTPKAEVPVDRPRRFSWEVGPEQVNIDPAEQEQSQRSPAAATPTVESSSAHSQEPSVPLLPAKTEKEEPRVQIAGGGGANMSVPQDFDGISHKVSQVSNVPRDRQDSEAIEPPSPVSVVADKNTLPSAEPRRQSLAEEKQLAQTSSNPVSPTPPQDEHPALASSDKSTPLTGTPSPGPQQQQLPVTILAFRQILELPSSAERIAKYNETRAQFASMDSGLNNWLIGLKAAHPEHAHASALFSGALSQAIGPGSLGAGQGQTSPVGSQPPTQQPYYQQYLNASSPNVNVAATGRAPASNLSNPSQAQSPSSDFRHSGNQVGAKGKELLRTAGKAGKGLLSKGKNKLRGTGDKVFL